MTMTVEFLFSQDRCAQIKENIVDEQSLTYSVSKHNIIKQDMA